MRILLDTHALIWFFSGDEKLSAYGHSLMEDIEVKKLISLASVWEMAIKYSKGKLNLAVPLEDYIEAKSKLPDFELLPITLSHLAHVSTLAFYHKDPFDRLLIAQGLVENIPILSRDIIFDNYKANRIWES